MQFDCLSAVCVLRLILDIKNLKMRCCIPTCENSKPVQRVHMFGFPSRNVRLWCHILQMDVGSIKENVKVCINHFRPDDLNHLPTCIRLKLNAVPCIDIGLDENEEEIEEVGEMQVEDVEQIEEVVQMEEWEEMEEQLEEREEMEEQLEEREEMEEQLEEREEMEEQLEEREEMQDVEMEVVEPLPLEGNEQEPDPVRFKIRNRRRLRVLPQPQLQGFSVERFCNNDKKIMHYTGIINYAMFLAIFNYVFKHNEEERGAVHHIKLKGKWRKAHKLSPKNEMFLTLMRMRRGIDLLTLGDMFNISKSAAGRIFHSWVELLYVKLGKLKMFPPREILLSRTSDDFLRKYPKVIGSIDCTEFIIQKPSSLVRQSQCFSHYKGATTLKALVMINPSGAIVFVSSLFTGSISDKKIVEESSLKRILKLKVERGELEVGDIILADKGFKIEDLLKDIGLELNIPCFLINGQHFTREEVEYTRKIAHERVHVERAIGRIKNYKYLSNVIPISVLTNINQVFSICAILTNFMGPLIKDK